MRADPSDLLVLLGDLVNKGPKSREVVARARRAGALAVRGNHDDAALAALAARNAARGSSCGTARSTLVVAAEVAVGAEDGAAAAAGGGSVVKGGKQTTKEMRGEKGGKKEGKHFATVYDWVEGMGQADVNYLAGLPHTISLPFLDPPVSFAHHVILSSRTRVSFARLFPSSSHSRHCCAHRLPALLASAQVLLVHAGLVPGVGHADQAPKDMTHMRNVIAAAPTDGVSPGSSFLGSGPEGGGGVDVGGVVVCAASGGVGSSGTAESAAGVGFVVEPMVACEDTSSGVAWTAVWAGPPHVYFGHDAKRRLQARMLGYIYISTNRPCMRTTMPANDVQWLTSGPPTPSFSQPGLILSSRRGRQVSTPVASTAGRSPACCPRRSAWTCPRGGFTRRRRSEGPPIFDIHFSGE